MSVWLLAALGGGLIILALALYAGRLLFQLKQRQTAQQQAQRAGIAARNARILESVQIIAKAMQSEQCDLSEGVIRLTHLLDALQTGGTRDFKAEFPGVYGLFAQIEHMPTHAARKALKRNEIMKMDLERSGFELTWEAQINAELVTLASLQLH
ncbi:MAG: DUF2489 domain-containing protein [Aeromonas sp.]